MISVSGGFQLTRPRGARLCKLLPRRSRDTSFNSRAREGRDTSARGALLSPAAFQLTRPRGARQQDADGRARRPPVSTHAPARGATQGGGVSFSWLQFQLTRPRGARLDPLRPSRRRIIRFQLTRPRGARRRYRGTARKAAKFQLTRPRGARLHLRVLPVLLVSFNSRAREGRDHHHPGTGDRPRGFNSRAREGRDYHHLPRRGWREVSTHAPARGATPSANAARRAMKFQLTRPRGARPRHRPGRPRRAGFNSRAREGRDSRRSDGISGPKQFQLTRPRGARRSRLNRFNFLSCFNSRAREGRDRHSSCSYA